MNSISSEQLQEPTVLDALADIYKFVLKHAPIPQPRQPVYHFTIDLRRVTNRRPPANQSMEANHAQG